MKDDHLRQALSFHTLLVGGSPFAASSIYALIHALERDGGVWFARGGTNALVAGDGAGCSQDLGGRLIVVRRGAARSSPRPAASPASCTSDGTFEAFDAVASNADIVHTYDQLLADDRRGRAVASSLKRRRFSPSLFVLHFGLKRTHPDLAHHTILFGPRYKGLIDEIYGKDAPRRRLLALPPRALRHRPQPRAARAARPTTRSRRCRTSAPRRSTGTSRARATPTASWPAIEARYIPGPEGRPGHPAASSRRRTSSAS